MATARMRRTQVPGTDQTTAGFCDRLETSTKTVQDGMVTAADRVRANRILETDAIVALGGMMDLLTRLDVLEGLRLAVLMACYFAFATPTVHVLAASGLQLAKEAPVPLKKQLGSMRLLHPPKHPHHLLLAEPPSLILEKDLSLQQRHVLSSIHRRDPTLQVWPSAAPSSQLLRVPLLLSGAFVPAQSFHA